MKETPLFVDMGYCQCRKHGQNTCGDAFKYLKIPDEHRLVAALSDGLGSGVKANILATMTAAMALKFAAENTELVHSAEIMMSALPICNVRKTSYATFTILDTALNGAAHIVEMGNPPFLLIRDGHGVQIQYEEVDSPKWENRTMRVYDFEVCPEDRLILFSDGISQAGMGSKAYPTGWKVQGCLEFIENIIVERRGISAHELTDAVIREALQKDAGMAGDDMTCAIVYYRTPRKMLLFTGAPYDRRRDAECAAALAAFEGDKAVCGGTTAEIIARELKRPVTLDFSAATGDLPPESEIEGINLVTEGIFTLTRAAQYLEDDTGINHRNAAGALVEMLLRNDIIEFVVGTRINEAHQDPNLPVDLEIRRNIVKRLALTLENKYLKEVHIRYV
ncbi:MAG: SpoIIE family protein phosphatase [Victivallaceae bacterium]